MRTLNPGSIHVYVLYPATSGLIKCIWQSAIFQYQFYLDRTHARLLGQAQQGDHPRPNPVFCFSQLGTLRLKCVSLKAAPPTV